MYPSILAILLDAKRGSVVAPLLCADCQHAIVLLRFAPVETLKSMRRSARRSIPSDNPIDLPIPIANRRGHPLDPMAGSQLAKLLPQGGIKVATKRLYWNTAAHSRNRCRAGKAAGRPRWSGT
jgi:hypothetical protein